jgi:hypothetical protein
MLCRCFPKDVQQVANLLGVAGKLRDVDFVDDIHQPTMFGIKAFVPHRVPINPLQEW